MYLRSTNKKNRDYRGLIIKFILINYYLFKDNLCGVHTLQILIFNWIGSLFFTFQLKGTKFEGTFKNDKAVLGKLTYPSGNSFEGTYNEKGNFEGKGKYTFQDGGYVVGTWVDHKLQGKGTMVDPNGNERNVTFKDGKIIN